MKLMVLNVPHDPEQGGFDGAAIADQVGPREIAQVIPIPWTRDGVPGLTLILGLSGPQQRPPRTAEQWRRELAEADRPVFDALREWRNHAAAERELSAFVICTNATLARVAALRPRDGVELLAVPGVGPMTVARYGDGLLAAVAAAGDAAAVASDAVGAQ